MSLRPADVARSLRFWRADQLRQLELVLELALRSWTSDWGLPGSAARVECRRAATRADAAVDGLALRAEGRAAWFCTGAWTGALVRELFGAPVAPTGIAGEAARACVDDATRRLAQALGMAEARWQEAAFPPGCSGAWDGEVQAMLAFDGVLLLNAVAVDACLRGGDMAQRPCNLPAASPVATPLLQAAATQRVRLRAQLQPCEIDLGVLQDLQAGDVLRIPHRLDAPLQVRAESGATLFNGYLAGSRGRKVLELAGAN